MDVVPRDLAYLIHDWVGWTTEELLEAMKTLLSVEDWYGSSDDNRLYILHDDNQPAPCPFLEIHSFGSRMYRRGGDVYAPLRYQL